MISYQEIRQEKIADMELMVHRLSITQENMRSIVQQKKTDFFAKWKFFKPDPEEVECQSIELFYEPVVEAKGKYFLDYFRKQTYSIRVDPEVSEVILLDKKFVPQEKKRFLRSSLKEVKVDAQERIVHKDASHLAINRTGREIDPDQIPHTSSYSDPEKALKDNRDKIRESTVSPDKIINLIRERIAQRPKNLGKIGEEIFEITEHRLIYTPIYETRCKNLESGEIKIIPLSGVTGKKISL